MSPEMLLMLPMLLLDVTLQIARKPNVHAGCDRTQLKFPGAGGGESRLNSIPAKACGKAVGKAAQGWERLNFFPHRERPRLPRTDFRPSTNLSSIVVRRRINSPSINPQSVTACDTLKHQKRSMIPGFVTL